MKVIGEIFSLLKQRKRAEGARLGRIFRVKRQSRKVRYLFSYPVFFI